MTLITSGFDVRASFVTLWETIAAEIQADIRTGISEGDAALVGLAADISLPVYREKAPEAFPSIQIWFFDGAGTRGREFVERAQVNIVTRSDDANSPDERLQLIIRDTAQHKLLLRSSRAQFKAYFNLKGHFVNPPSPQQKYLPARLEFAGATGWGPLPGDDDDPYVSGITRDFNIFYKK